MFYKALNTLLHYVGFKELLEVISKGNSYKILENF